MTRIRADPTSPVPDLHRSPWHRAGQPSPALPGRRAVLILRRRATRSRWSPRRS